MPIVLDGPIRISIPEDKFQHSVNEKRIRRVYLLVEVFVDLASCDVQFIFRPGITIDFACKM